MDDNKSCEDILAEMEESRKELEEQLERKEVYEYDNIKIPEPLKEETEETKAILQKKKEEIRAMIKRHREEAEKRAETKS